MKLLCFIIMKHNHNTSQISIFLRNKVEKHIKYYSQCLNQTLTTQEMYITRNSRLKLLGIHFWYGNESRGSHP